MDEEFNSFNLEIGRETETEMFAVHRSQIKQNWYKSDFECVAKLILNNVQRTHMGPIQGQTAKNQLRHCIWIGAGIFNSYFNLIWIFLVYNNIIMKYDVNATCHKAYKIQDSSVGQWELLLHCKLNHSVFIFIHWCDEIVARRIYWWYLLCNFYPNISSNFTKNIYVHVLKTFDFCFNLAISIIFLNEFQWILMCKKKMLS